jgi:hypothetical protein
VRTTRLLAGLITVAACCFATLTVAQPPVQTLDAVQAQPLREEKAPFPKKLLRLADSYRSAAADAVSRGDDAVNIRYVTLYNIRPEKREAYKKGIDFTVNSLSQRKTIVFTTFVPGTDKSLLAVDLYQLQIDAKQWDDLGQKGSGPIRSVRKIDQPEPYAHNVVELDKAVGKKKVKKQVHAVDEKTGKKWYHEDGRPWLEEQEVDEDVKEKAEELQHAGYLPQADVVSLVKATGTDFPMFRGDWLVANALIAPAYNNFLGFKNLADVQRVGRFRARDKDLAVRAVVTFSDEVAEQQRGVEYRPTASGEWWETFDFFTSVRANDVLANPLFTERDASEIIFSLPNTLQAYALVNDSKKNEVIDVADGNVAQDTRTPWRNKLVWDAVSCITCHDKGIKAITDEVRLLAGDKVQLLIKDKKDAQKVTDYYATPIEEAVARGQTMYARAVNIVTQGWTSQQLAAFISEVHVGYRQDGIDLEMAALEVGVQPGDLGNLLSRIRGPDHTLSQLYAKRLVRRDQWEAKGFAQLSTAVYSDEQGGGKDFMGPKQHGAGLPMRGGPCYVQTGRGHAQPVDFPVLLCRGEHTRRAGVGRLHARLRPVGSLRLTP